MESSPTIEWKSVLAALLKKHLSLVALVVIFGLTLANGFYDSLQVEYLRTHFTFLDSPADRHADLIRAALSMPPFGPDFAPGRDDFYAKFYVDPAYHGLDGIPQGKLTAFHLTPFTILSLIGLKQLLLAFGPGKVVHLYYIAAFAILVLMLIRVHQGWIKTLISFLVLALSYPFLMILVRGNFSALVTSACLFLFIRELLLGKRILPAALLLALAFNFRPNVIFLVPLLLILGWKNGLKCLCLFGAAAASLLLASYSFAVQLYPGYQYSVFVKALKIYQKEYVLGKMGDSFNNSIYGGLKPFAEMWFSPEKSLHPEATFYPYLKMELVAITVIIVVLALLFVLLYLRRQISPYAYALAFSLLYVLGTPIFATYHLFFLAIFILLLDRSPSLEPPRASGIYWLAGILILLFSPKNYFYYEHYVSWEVTLNPVLLLAALLLIFLYRDRVPKKVPFWQSLNRHAEPASAPGG